VPSTKPALARSDSQKTQAMPQESALSTGPDPVESAVSHDVPVSPLPSLAKTPALSSHTAPSAPAPALSSAERGILSILIHDISPNPFQPRMVFDDARLEEMAQSIRERGILQPLLVRSKPGGGYQLIAGERRLRAAKIAGLTQIPALLANFSDQEVLEAAIVENLQRDDLNPIEEAHAYDSLIKRFGLAHEEVARRVGKDRSTIVNTLRLLRLPADIQDDLRAKRLTAGHARALLALDSEAQALRLREDIHKHALSVRQTEDRARQMLGQKEKASKPRNMPESVAADIRRLEERLVDRLSAKVRLRISTPSTGRIEIAYSSLDELERLCQLLGVGAE